MKKCSVCGERIWFNNYQVCLQIDKILEGDSIKPGCTFYCCKKCFPKLEWDLDSVARQMGDYWAEVPPIESIVKKMGVINSER